MNDVVRVSTANGTTYVMAWCIGCQMAHRVPVNISTGWDWNGDTVLPTLSPSLLVQGGEDNIRCHSFIRNGVWEYLSDCTHDRAGMRVPMMPWDAE